MASTKIAERTYSVLLEFFTKNTPFLNHDKDWFAFWEKQIKLGVNSEIYTNPKLRNAYTENAMFVLLVDCEAEIRAETAKSIGANDCFKVMEKTIKENAKNGQERFAGAYYTQRGDAIVTNGYYALQTNKEVVLPRVEEERFPVSIVGIIKKAYEENKTQVSIPTLSELKAYIKLKKAEKTLGEITYELGDGYVYVKADYLKRVIEFLGDNNIECYTVWEPDRRPIAPLLFTNNSGEIAILCPVKKY